MQTYCKTLMAVDETVSIVMDYLKAAGFEQNAMIIYVGDNGFSWGKHGPIDKRHFYEGNVKAPLLAYVPGNFTSRQTVERMIQKVDVALAILELAALKKPDYVPDKSFIQLLKGDTTNWRVKIFYE